MINDVEITKVSFPEGEFDFVWCLISYDEESISFESFIGVDVSIPNATTASQEFQIFDQKVLSYANDWDEFEEWVKDGGFDFKILDYERKSLNV